MLNQDSVVQDRDFSRQDRDQDCQISVSKGLKSLELQARKITEPEVNEWSVGADLVE